MSKDKDNPPPANFEDGIMAAKAAREAKNAQKKKDQTESDKGGTKGFQSKLGRVPTHSNTKASVPRIQSRQKKGGG